MFFNPIVLFFRACRKFGFWRTLIGTVVGVIALSLAVQAFAAPPPSHRPGPNDWQAFDGSDGSICSVDGSICPASVHLQARLTNRASRNPDPVIAQLLMTVRVSQCAEITCGGTLLPAAQLRPIIVFLDGHQLMATRVGWKWLGGEASSDANRRPLNASMTFISSSIPLGFAGFCGWHALRFGILGDKWKDSRWSNASFPLWTLTGPLPFYSGDCPARASSVTKTR